MYMFGGSKASGIENSKFFQYDIRQLTWKEIIPKGDFIPDSRDEHSACVHDGYMVVFGGFEKGVRTNTMARYHFESNTWS